MLAQARSCLFAFTAAALLAAPLVGVAPAPTFAADSAIAKDCDDRLQQVRLWLRTSMAPVSEEDQAKLKAAIAEQLSVCAKAEAAHPDDGAVALSHAYANFAAKNPQIAVKLIEKAAELGHPPAQVTLARMVTQGKYMMADKGRAQLLIDAAAKSSHEDARMQAAMEFMPGRIGPENPARANRIFQEMIDAKSARAMMIYATQMLGIVRKGGIAKPETVKKGIALIHRAADELKDPNAMIYLALAHLQGKLVKEDPEIAKTYALAAIAAGSARANGTMGQIYQKAGDFVAAAEWFEKGAEGGDGFSQTMTGFMYSGGFGVKQNLDLAVEWWTKARWNGDRLGASYLKVHKERNAAMQAQEAENEELVRKHQEELKKQKAGTTQ